MQPKILLITIFVAVRIDVLISSGNELIVFECKTDEDVRANVNVTLSGIVPIILIENGSVENVKRAGENWMREYFSERQIASLLIVTADTCRLSNKILNQEIPAGIEKYPSLCIMKFGQILPQKFNISKNDVEIAYDYACSKNTYARAWRTFYLLLNAEMDEERVRQKNQQAPSGRNLRGTRMSDPKIKPTVNKLAPRVANPVSTSATSSMNPSTNPAYTRSFTTQPATRAENTVSTRTSVSVRTTNERTPQQGEGSTRQTQWALSPESSWNDYRSQPLPYHQAEQPVRTFSPAVKWVDPRESTARVVNQLTRPVVPPTLQLAQSLGTRKEPEPGMSYQPVRPGGPKSLKLFGQEIRLEDDRQYEGGSNMTPSQNHGLTFLNKQDRNKRPRTDDGTEYL